jgi:hypothetical protein
MADLQMYVSYTLLTRLLYRNGATAHRRVELHGWKCVINGVQALIENEAVQCDFQFPLGPGVHLLQIKYISQSQSHVMADDQSVSQSWCRGPFGSHDQILISV